MTTENNNQTPTPLIVEYKNWQNITFEEFQKGLIGKVLTDSDFQILDAYDNRYFAVVNTNPQKGHELPTQFAEVPRGRYYAIPARIVNAVLNNTEPKILYERPPSAVANSQIQDNVVNDFIYNFRGLAISLMALRKEENDTPLMFFGKVYSIMTRFGIKRGQWVMEPVLGVGDSPYMTKPVFKQWIWEDSSPEWEFITKYVYDRFKSEFDASDWDSFKSGANMPESLTQYNTIPSQGFTRTRI